ncbi:MAG: hypothetical protein KDA33_12215 [Phycisphaerales bacterium]|nr:hypothetical protein [Phycisphaerales bacterium]
MSFLRLCVRRKRPCREEGPSSCKVLNLRARGGKAQGSERIPFAVRFAGCDGGEVV